MFGERLELALKALSIDRSRLAADLGVHKSVVSRWVSGVSRPSAPNLERLTARVAARLAGFTPLDWELDAGAFAQRLGLTLSPKADTRSAPPRFGDWLPPRILEEAEDTTRRRGFAYEGFWRTTRAAPSLPGRYLHDYSLLWTAENGMLMWKLSLSGYALRGWCLPLRNQLFAMASHEPSGLLVFSVFNGVPRQKAEVIDGITLSCLLDAGGSPVAGACVMERIGDLTGDPTADELRFKAYRAEPVLAPEESIAPAVCEHLASSVAAGDGATLLLDFGRSMARGAHLGYVA